APSVVALEPGQALVVLLRPERPFDDAIEARVFVEEPAGSQQREPVPFATEALPASSGALRISIAGRELPARGRVLVLVGRPGSVPSVPAGSAAHGRNWQRFDIDVEPKTPSPPPR
ncbi:MAG TPA: hypothetical protein VMG12_11880, partial [Polyangiaceae bacterium]|nr:hypothetical protein [Polyangiaceae bacterium]